jgi:hypothetical protein
MPVTRRPSRDHLANRSSHAGLTHEELRVRLEEELRRHPTRSKFRSWKVPGQRKHRPHASARYRRQRLLAVILPALVAGGVVVLLAHGSGDSARVTGPPIPKGIESRAARAEHRPQVIVAPPAPAKTRSHPIGPIRLPRPVEVAIPGVGVSARVGAVGARNGHIELPPVRRAGWFKGGPRPGEPGRTVIIGHVDTRNGPAVFADLPKARRGDAIQVTDAGGRVRRYRVVSAISVPKAYFPFAQVYAPTPTSTLALITCGGAFDSKTRHYDDNVVVYAQPAGERPRQDSNLRPTA